MVEIGDNVRFTFETQEGIVSKITDDSSVVVKMKNGTEANIDIAQILALGTLNNQVPNFFARLKELADAAHLLAEGVHGESFVEVKADDEVGMVEKAFHEIAKNLEIQKRRQYAQYAATKVLSESHTLKDAIPNILRAISEGLGWQWAAMWTIDTEADLLVCGGVWQANISRFAEFTQLSEGITFVKGTGLPGRVWGSGEPSWISDVQTDLNFPRRFVARKVGLHGAFCFPIRSAHRVLGVMEFLTIHKEDPDKSLLNMMNAIGSQIGQFIERKLAEELTAQKVEELSILHLNLERDFASKMQDSLRLNAQYGATKVLAEADSFAKATPKLLKSICEGLGWECALMWEVNEETEVLDWVDCWNVPEGDFTDFKDMSFNMTFLRGRGLPGRVWDNNEPLWILDVVKDTNFPRAKMAEKSNLHGAFAFPIQLKNKVLGVMEFFSTKTQAPDDALLAMMGSIGSQIGQFIERKNAEEQAKIYLANVEKQYEEINAQNEEINMQNEELTTTLELVEQERRKSDKLLLNILPEETAYELKETGHATPKHYELITVLFTDFKGFTHIAEKISPQEVIENLNTCFLAFDEICEKYNLEKIKTIGDSYMCAGGLPVANTTNPIDTIQAGLEMQTWMANWKMEKEAKGEPAWELRLGIHSGEAIAGVVGKNKFAYDIWGDTVNLASRMESSGEVGKVNISGTTYELVKHQFECTHRGEVKAKNKGKVEMYFVEKMR